LFLTNTLLKQITAPFFKFKQQLKILSKKTTTTTTVALILGTVLPTMLLFS